MPGVLFEGGSLRPVFSCGVMDALLEEEVMFPYCIGVSAGAADAASYISKQKGRNIQMLEQYRNDKRYISKRNFLKEKSLFGIQFVFRDIPNKLIPFDMDTFQSYQGTFLITATDAHTGETKYFTQKDVDREFNVFCATCALPVAFPAITVNGREYYDGGLSNPIPIDKVMEDGNEKALIVLTRPEGFRKECGRSDRMAARAVQRKYPVIAHQLRTRYEKYNQSVAECERLEKEGKAVILRPETELDSYEKDVKTLRHTYETGYEMARKRMQDIKKLFDE
ncbi:MAG: patatin family protein [Butyribacter sp.]|nr:patatin family protein [bacterium]MDY3853638.1 patatin family protein [Butyribacter sp.]